MQHPCNLSNHLIQQNFYKGTIYTGPAKSAKVPDSNHFCPAATGSCPIGKHFQAVVDLLNCASYYITGILILNSQAGLFVITICQCQHLLHKTPFKKISTKKPRLALFGSTSYIRPVWVSTALIQNAAGMGEPYFCICCPQGILREQFRFL